MNRWAVPLALRFLIIISWEGAVEGVHCYYYANRSLIWNFLALVFVPMISLYFLRWPSSEFSVPSILASWIDARLYTMLCKRQQRLMSWELVKRKPEILCLWNKPVASLPWSSCGCKLLEHVYVHTKTICIELVCLHCLSIATACTCISVWTVFFALIKALWYWRPLPISRDMR